MKTTIVWKSADYGFVNGYVGLIKLFCYGHDGTMARGTITDKPYKLTCTLPQVDSIMLKDSKECENRAEKILRDYLSYLKYNMNSGRSK